MPYAFMRSSEVWSFGLTESRHILSVLASIA